MQDHGYDLITARHYAAYRPPLHANTLALGPRNDERFDQALDIGCGTGNSTHALGRWCHQVLGMDPGVAMIELSHSTEGGQVSTTAREGD